MSNDALARRIREALAIVIDPELGKNVVEMGLIYAIECDSDGKVAIAMTTTTRGCPAASFLTEAVRERAAQVEGVHDVDVTLTYDPPWTPDMMAG
ncbi:metal-sulfur cluster biosynthetic enzyme [Rhizobium azooxidifex]|uniref:Metal-sulfur cluster biosynthetic enzyme n=1 Tax=Mycoplana azooxidifex TaxID=1636188 RepID=A0A7W6GJ79_9HYPH|nr:iron-sulfur cluster assembly protein [Mycoplana azooxidifex]MBB3975619.1 metal-sulfur cluster biosynthetic enzyme [Mycoplana azooxidifex]